jgi:hypothetical protein
VCLTVHVIRLRGPWECERVENHSQSVVRCLRRFNRPTGLGTCTRVWLVCDALPCPALLRFNGAELGSVPGRFEIAHLLSARNEVSMELQGCPGELPRTIDGVRLEIEE